MDMISDFAVLLFALEAALRFDLHGILCAHFLLPRAINLLRRWRYMLATPDLPVRPQAVAASALPCGLAMELKAS